MRKTELVGLEPIQDLIELTLMTPYVKGERTVSLLVLAEPETGRTELMKKYKHNRGVHVRRRFTACGILTDLIQGKIQPLFDKPKILGDIFVYEYSSLQSYKPNTANSTTEFQCAISEEGLSPESSYWIRGDELKKFEGLKGGIIAGINTFGFFTSGRKVKTYLYKGGWLSRNVVVSYEMSEELKSKIHERIRDLARNLAEEYSEDLKPYKLNGFRLHKSLISLVKASALRDGRKTVS